ncbi:MAG: DNA repair protein RecO [Candidatus Nealsonbacteria bacterium RBG_13_38_11]|uniref:DNA repair protein RecO n=1 Tax=Candidatus Nealsonbacteria bacterium RBG_13_38_11 TaxID=1801662 RepID=A0A1G2E032_9BACT|nr:MAG: DNA repair protein RecO [Candidatus Nealsonbacteria bacterium RBG_13_38_11]
MFTHYRTQGFILKKSDVGEADRLFAVFTKDFGKLELLARAERKIKSKLRSGLELFYLSEIEFIQGKAYKTLTDAILIESFGNLRKSLKAVAIASKIAEISDSLLRGQEPDEKLWQLFRETFKILNDQKIKTETRNLVYHYFLWNFLSLLGYQLDFYRCASCQKKLVPEKIYFSFKKGGLVCSGCGKTENLENPISLNAIKLIRILLEKNLSALSRLKVEKSDLDSLKEISNYYFSEILRETQ